MPRASMATIIAYTRRLIGDTAVTPQFTDAEIQDVCDRRQSQWRLIELKGIYSIFPGGVFRFLDFFAETGIWEDDVLLQDNAWATLTPTTSDLQSGHWTFATQPNWPVYLTGKVYDINAIAADLCEMWAAKFIQNHDNQSGQFKNSRSQWYTHMTRQARIFRAQAKTTSARIMRSDLEVDPEVW